MIEKLIRALCRCKIDCKLHTDVASGNDTVISTDGCIRINQEGGRLVYRLFYGYDRKQNKLFYKIPVGLNDAVMLMQLRAAILSNDEESMERIRHEYGLGAIG